jgi:hypothetical protein
MAMELAHLSEHGKAFDFLQDEPDLFVHSKSIA